MHGTKITKKSDVSNIGSASQKFATEARRPRREKAREKVQQEGNQMEITNFNESAISLPESVLYSFSVSSVSLWRIKN
jgi:hypothetical protein